MSWLAAIEIDRRQQVITSTDKLKELLGGSWTIGDTPGLIAEGASTEVLLPVSGSVWLRSRDLNELRGILWKARKDIVETRNLPCTFAIAKIGEAANGDTSAAEQSARVELERRIRRNKAAKCGGDGTPSLPLLASCMIQPALPANEWVPGIVDNAQHRRRALTHFSSLGRLKRGFGTMKAFLERFPEAKDLDPASQWPWQFRDLASFPNDQYIALLKADADNMSALARDVPLGELRDFGEALESTIWQALQEAVTLVVKGKKWKRFPVVPIVRAGEDTSILCRRDLALDLAIHFAANYARLARENEKLSKAAGATLSMGILFVRQGFPFEIMWDYAEDLQSSAKRARHRYTAELKDGKGGLAAPDPPTGWLDFLWLQSSGREDPEALRERYSDGKLTFHLSSRPWTFPEARAMMDLAVSLHGLVPPRKWVELGQILRLGDEFSQLGWKRWLTQLRDEQRDKLLDGLAGQKLSRLAPAPGKRAVETPWLCQGDSRITPLLDLVEIVRTLEQD